MVIHTCPKCFKEFNMYSSFISHTEKRKKSCIPSDNAIKCIHCNKKYSRREYLNKHLLTCGKIEQRTDEKKIDEINNSIISTDSEEQTTNDLLKLARKEIKRLKEENQNLKNKDSSKNKSKNGNGNQNSNILGNNNNTTINNINFHIVDHGTEDYDNVDLKAVLESSSIMLKMIEEIHCNPENPEYQNILITDKTRNLANVFRQDKWICENKNVIVQDLINRTYLHLNVLKDKLITKYKEKIEREIDAIIVNRFDSFNAQRGRNLKQSISNVIYDNKDMIKDTYKQHEMTKKMRNEQFYKKKFIKFEQSEDSDESN